MHSLYFLDILASGFLEMSSTVMFIHCFSLTCNYVLYMAWALQGQLNTLSPSVTAWENKPFFIWYIQMWRFSDHFTGPESLNIIVHFQAFRWVWLEIVVSLLLKHSSILKVHSDNVLLYLQLPLLNCRLPVQILLLDVFHYQSEGLDHYWHVNKQL